MPVLAAQPGTEIKVTPEMLAPIMPKATIHQGDWRPARKKALLPWAPCVELWREITKSMKKYANNVANINQAEIVIFLEWKIFVLEMKMCCIPRNS